MKLAFFGAAAAAVLASNATAWAHATLETPQAKIGKPYKAVIRIAHGCAGQATQTVRIAVPAELVNAKPMPKAGWRIATAKGPYSQPYDNHGRMMHEGVREIVWTGGSLADEHYDEFVFIATIAPSAAARAVYVPVEQECEAGAERWVQSPSAENPGERLKSPAPRLELVANENQPAPRAQTVIGALKIEAPWTRATPKGAQVGGGYLRVVNTGKEPDRLIGGTFPLAGRVEIHEMSMDGGMMKMRHLEKGLEIKPGETVELRPGGFHIMFMQLKQGIVVGAPVKGTLVFEKAGRVEIEYSVAPIGAREMPAAAGHSGHGHH